MRVTVAQRPTICRKCREDIAVGNLRIDHTAKKQENYFRTHYHMDCYKQLLDELGEKERKLLAEKQPQGGHFLLPLTEDERILRQRLLTRLGGVVRYYVGSLDLQKPNSSVTAEEKKRLLIFHYNITLLVKQLNNLGGRIPERYQKLQEGLDKTITGLGLQPITDLPPGEEVYPADLTPVEELDLEEEAVG